MNFSAVILAGGKSSRMGRDKALLEVGGETLLARQLRVVRETGAAEIFISGRPHVDYSAFRCPVLLDQHPDLGPLAGIERALNAITNSQLLVLAVDLPQMSAALLRQLAVAASETCGVIPELAGRLEPLVAFYPKSAHALAAAQIACRRLAAKDFAKLCAQSGLVRIIEMPPETSLQFTNFNSPADLHRRHPPKSHRDDRK